MYKSIIVLFIMFFAQYDTLHSKGPYSLMIYFKGEEILSPLIETKISKFQNDSYENLFSSVTTLNTIYANLKYEITLREAMSYYTNGGFETPTSSKDANHNIADMLSKYDYILIIDIKKINILLEYQIYLYKPFSQEAQNEFPMTNVLSPLYSASFIADLSDHNFERSIENELKKIFPESNVSPTGKCKINDQIIYRDTTIYWPTLDTLLLDARYSEDVDTPNDFLKCYWSQTSAFGTKTISADEIISIKKQSFVQKILLHKVGTYKIQFIVDDGIEYSSQINITIICYEKPFISLNKYSDNFFYYDGYNTIFKNQYLVVSSIPLKNCTFYTERLFEPKDISINNKIKSLQYEVLKTTIAEELPFDFNVSYETYNNGYSITLNTTAPTKNIDYFKHYCICNNIKSNEVVIKQSYHKQGVGDLSLSLSKPYSIKFNYEGNKNTQEIDLKTYPGFLVFNRLTVKGLSILYGAYFWGNNAYYFDDNNYFEITPLDVVWGVSYTLPIYKHKKHIFEQQKPPRFFVSWFANTSKFDVLQHILDIDKTRRETSRIYTFGTGMSFKPILQFPFNIKVDLNFIPFNKIRGGFYEATYGPLEVRFGIYLGFENFLRNTNNK